jgi:hypothetical protein
LDAQETLVPSFDSKNIDQSSSVLSPDLKWFLTKFSLKDPASLQQTDTNFLSSDIGMFCLRTNRFMGYLFSKNPEYTKPMSITENNASLFGQSASRSRLDSLVQGSLELHKENRVKIGDLKFSACWKYLYFL